MVSVVHRRREPAVSTERLRLGVRRIIALLRYASKKSRLLDHTFEFRPTTKRPNCKIARLKKLFPPLTFVPFPPTKRQQIHRPVYNL